MTQKRKRPLQTVVAVVLVIGLWFAREKGWIAQSDPRTTPQNTPSHQTSDLTRLSGRCVSVIDGDTIDVVIDGKKQRVRVLGIDCAETYNKDKAAQQSRTWNQSPAAVLRLGNAAKAFANETCYQQDVEVVVGYEGRDDYGRLLAYVEINGVDLGTELLILGLAEARREPHSRKSNYHDLERTARSNKLGLWSNSRP